MSDTHSLNHYFKFDMPKGEKMRENPESSLEKMKKIKN